jgi:hypothetical protein
MFGCDTDTNAAIAGALLGPFTGATPVPLVAGSGRPTDREIHSLVHPRPEG